MRKKMAQKNTLSQANAWYLPVAKLWQPGYTLIDTGEIINASSIEVAY